MTEHDNLQKTFRVNSLIRNSIHECISEKITEFKDRGFKTTDINREGKVICWEVADSIFKMLEIYQNKETMVLIKSIIESAFYNFITLNKYNYCHDCLITRAHGIRWIRICYRIGCFLDRVTVRFYKMFNIEGVNK